MCAKVRDGLGKGGKFTVEGGEAWFSAMLARQARMMDLEDWTEETKKVLRGFVYSDLMWPNPQQWYVSVTEKAPRRTRSDVKHGFEYQKEGQ